MAGILARAGRPGAQEQIHHVSVVRFRAAQGRIAKIYAQVERDFGILAPPVILHSPAPDALAAAWVMLRETLIAVGRADRGAKEAVAAAVSHANTCPYCVEVHSMTLYGLARGHDAAAVAAGRLHEVRDPRIRAVAAWARESGRPQEVPRPPFVGDQAVELIGVAAVFHYYNRMVNVFLDESPFPPGASGRIRDGLMKVIGRAMRPTSRRLHRPGASLNLLPAAPPPPDLAWAAGNPTVADALARAAAAIEAGGRRSVPDAVRAVVDRELAGWDGRPPGPSRTWVEDALSGLPAAERTAGRLALLTAMASYQVDPSVVEDFRRDVPGDAPLIELVAWAAFAAARRVGALAAETLGATPRGRTSASRRASDERGAM